MPEQIVEDTHTDTHREAFDFYFRLSGMFVFFVRLETKELVLRVDLVFTFGPTLGRFNHI